MLPRPQGRHTAFWVTPPTDLARKHKIDGSAVLTVFLVYLAGVVIPGPNFVAVVSRSVIR